MCLKILLAGCVQYIEYKAFQRKTETITSTDEHAQADGRDGPPVVDEQAEHHGSEHEHGQAMW